MLTSSRKAKGRQLQKWVRERILALFPMLSNDDVRSTSMGAGGEDLLLSSAAKAKFPYVIECKNQQGFTNTFNAYYQACTHLKSKDDLLVPLVVLKMNKLPPLVVMSFENFERLHVKSTST